MACEQRCSQASHAVAEVHGVFTAFALRLEPCAQVECCEDDIIEDPEQRLEEAEIHTTIDMETLLCAAGDSNRHFFQVSGQCIERVQAVASLGGPTFATWARGGRLATSAYRMEALAALFPMVRMRVRVRDALDRA